MLVEEIDCDTEIKTCYKYNEDNQLIHELKSNDDRVILEQKQLYSEGELVKTEVKELIDGLYYETWLSIEYK